MTITIVGVGLIGGSMALSLKERGFADKVIGVGRSQASLDKAMDLGLIDKKEDLETGIGKADLVVLAIPMNALSELLPEVLDQVTGKQVVIDVGSTKSTFLNKIKTHKNRSRFVATHPMAGTEYSGPEAAIDDLFDNKCAVLCDVNESSGDAVDLVRKLYETLNMKIVHIDGDDHDVHAAYVSHISHISSFALALTVLEKEKEEKRIFELASGGFESTVRLAKSSPDTWVPIFMENRHYVLDVLYEMIIQLKKMKNMLVDKDEEGFRKLIEEANAIKRIIH